MELLFVSFLETHYPKCSWDYFFEIVWYCNVTWVTLASQRFSSIYFSNSYFFMFSLKWFDTFRISPRDSYSKTCLYLNDIMDGNLLRLSFISQSKYFSYLAHLLLYINYLYKFVSLDIKDTHLILSFKPFLMFWHYVFRYLS